MSRLGGSTSLPFRQCSEFKSYELRKIMIENNGLNRFESELVWPVELPNTVLLQRNSEERNGREWAVMLVRIKLKTSINFCIPSNSTASRLHSRALFNKGWFYWSLRKDSKKICPTGTFLCARNPCSVKRRSQPWWQKQWEAIPYPMQCYTYTAHLPCQLEKTDEFLP